MILRSSGRFLGWNSFPTARAYPFDPRFSARTRVSWVSLSKKPIQINSNGYTQERHNDARYSMSSDSYFSPFSDSYNSPL